MTAASAPNSLFARYPDADAITAARQHHIADVEVAGTVAAAPSFFYGRHTHAWHEEFPIITQHGLVIDVIDNVKLAPCVPLTTGDVIAVKGQFIPRGNGGIVHDTHHSPGAGWHEGGWIEWHGQRYL